MAGQASGYGIGSFEMDNRFENSFCQKCDMQALIYRSWRKDYVCGECLTEYDIVVKKTYSLRKK